MDPVEKIKAELEFRTGKLAEQVHDLKQDLREVKATTRALLDAITKLQALVPKDSKDV